MAEIRPTTGTPGPSAPSTPSQLSMQDDDEQKIQSKSKAVDEKRHKSMAGTGVVAHKKDTKEAAPCSVKVVIRPRPGPLNGAVVVDPFRKEVRVNKSHKTAGAKDAAFTFDQVFDTQATQAQVYTQCVEPLVNEVLKGFNCTVFAYGQTGTGKTHTMEGDCSKGLDSENCGVIPRAFTTIFRNLQGKQFTVKVSCVEIYNEVMRDLLSDDENRAVGMFDDPGKGTVLNNLLEVQCTTPQDAYDLIKKSQSRRHIGETKMNEKSSRSHCVFMVTVHSKSTELGGDTVVSQGRLHLVDLAGSESLQKSGAQGAAARETANINKSLLALGRVIEILVNQSQQYIPYRDSKLTRLLSQSLGGTAKTIILAMVSLAVEHLDVTLSTLNYANMAKKIQNKPMANAVVTEKAYITNLTAEIADLQKQLTAQRAKDNGVFVAQESYDKMNKEAKEAKDKIEELQNLLQAKENELATLKELIERKDTELAVKEQEKKAVEQKLATTEVVLSETKDALHETTVDLGAHKQLVERQGETERALHATIEVERVDSDKLRLAKNLLHDKIQRIFLVEEFNRNASVSVKENVANKTNALETQASSFVDGQCAAHAAVSAKISEFTKAHTKALGALSSEAEQARGRAGEQQTAMETAAAEFANARTADAASQLQQTLAHHTDVSARLGGIKTQMADGGSELKSKLGAHSTQLQQWTTTELAAYANERLQMTEFSSRQSSLLSKLNAEAQKRQAERKAEIESFGAVFKTALEQEEKDMASSLAQLMAMVTAQVEALARSHAAAKASLQSIVSSTLQSLVARVDKDAADYTANVDSLLAAQSAFGQQRADSLSKHETDAKTAFANAEKSTAAVGQAVEALHSDVQAKVAALSDAEAKQVESVKAAHQARCDADAKFMAEQKKAGVAMASERTAVGKAHQEAVARLSSSCEAAAGEWSKHIEEQAKTARAFAKDHSAGVQEVGAAVNRFHDDFKLDIRTGETPPRVPFAARGPIPKTGDPQALIAHFKGANKLEFADLSSASEPRSTTPTHASELASLTGAHPPQVNTNVEDMVLDESTESDSGVSSCSAGPTPRNASTASSSASASAPAAEGEKTKPTRKAAKENPPTRKAHARALSPSAKDKKKVAASPHRSQIPKHKSRAAPSSALPLSPSSSRNSQ